MKTETLMKEEGLKADDKLPQGWIKIELQEVGEIITGNTPPKKDSDNYGNDYPWVKPADLDTRDIIKQTTESLSEKGAKKARLLEPETVMVSCIGILGKVGFAGKTLATNQQINSIAFDKRLVYPRYGFFYCKTLSEWMNQNSSATTVSIINKTRFSQAPFLLPPLNEQKRIVAKLEKLLAKVNESCDRLSRIPTILKRFRQSVLASAFSGRLTADWRQSHPDIEPAEELLKRIQEERIKRYEEECIKAKAEGRRKPQKYQKSELIKNNFDLLPDLPNNWCLIRVYELADYIPRSMQSGPFGSSLLHSEFQNTGILAIGIDNVLDGTFSLGKEHRISFEKYKELEKYRARPLDVLITVMSTVGRCCVVPPDIETAIITKHVYRISSDQKLTDPYYLMNALRGSSFVLSQIDQNIRGATRPGINGEILKQLIIPVPPIEEQKEIVRRVKALFRKCDLIEERYLKAKAYIDKLTQSILAKAFRGELVPQDPNDELAEVLLERIREEKTLTEKSSKSNRKTTKSI